MVVANDEPRLAPSISVWWLPASGLLVISSQRLFLLRQPDGATKTTGWDGVRSFQARNFLRDSIKRGPRLYSAERDPVNRGIAEGSRKGTRIRPSIPTPTISIPKRP